MPDTDDGYTVVQNVTHARVVFSSLGKDYLITWHSPREHDGQDIQRVPQRVMEDAGFRKTIAKGMLVVTTEAALEEAMRTQIAAEASRDSIENQAAQVLDHGPSSIVISEEAINAGVDGTARSTSSIERLLGAGTT